jgi:hypothetical protein
MNTNAYNLTHQGLPIRLEGVHECSHSTKALEGH